MIKTTGAEFKAFYSDKTAWPDGSWHEDYGITVDGVNACEEDIDLTNVPDSSKITIEGGVILMNADAIDGPSLESHFRAWRKRQNTVTLAVTVDKAKESQLRELLKEFGAKFS